MANIAVLGYGTVGSGVVEVINTNKDIIAKTAGEVINIKYVLDLREFPGTLVENLLVKDYDVILNDDDIKVVVEVMGGTNPSYDFVKKALERGKSVATSNKELVAKHGTELLKIAKDNNTNFMFEASVGGGIPIIRPLNQCLTADRIYEISGILNGTTNFILTKMEEDGLDFDEALKLAQDNGFAEKNPDADILGHDACRKIAILSSLASGKFVDFNDISTEGITEVTVKDMKYARKMKCTIKLLAISRISEKETFARVSPVVIGADNQLSTVTGVFNAIMVKGNVVGDVMFYGMGAGKLPTASAVVSDVIQCVKYPDEVIMSAWTTEKLSIADINNSKVKYLVRFGYTNLDELRSKLSDNFAGIEIIDLDEDDNEIGIVTPEMTEAEISVKLSKFSNILNKIRFEK